MDEFTFRIVGRHGKIERNKHISNRLKIIAAACLFFAVCYCLGTKTIGYVEKSEAIMTNVVWFFSVIILTGIFIKDSSNVKKNKDIEFDIYRLELENRNNKIETAKITGEIVPDYILNKTFNVPDENIKLPYIYYGILILIDNIIRIYINSVLSI